MSRASRLAVSLSSKSGVEEKQPQAPDNVMSGARSQLRDSRAPARRSVVEKLEQKLRSMDEDLTTFPPTNFYVTWPPEALNATQGNGANNWIRPKDLLPKPWHPKGAREFPGRMAAHDMNFPRALQPHDQRNPFALTNTQQHNHESMTMAAAGGGAVAVSVPVSSLSLNSVRPLVPKPPEAVALMSSPSPASYNLKPLSATAAPHFFTGNAKTFQTLLHRDHSVNLAPGCYNPIPVFSESHGNPAFDKSPRFPDSSLKSATIGPGHYNINLNSVASESGVHSFSSRPLSIPHRRSRLPDCGTYHVPESLYKTAPIHRFASSPRFDYAEKSLPAHAALVLSDARRREREIRTFKPNLQEYTRQRKEAAIEAQKNARESKLAAIEELKRKQRMEHEEKVDRIMNKEKYREMARQEREARELFIRVQREWLMQSALAARTQIIKDAVRTVRTQVMLRQLAQEAAKTIQKFCLAWLQRARTNRRRRAALVIYRALRRNVLRAHLKRKRWAMDILTRTFLDDLHKRHALARIRFYISQAIKIQRTWRRFYICRDHSIQLLERQWAREEDDLCEKYQIQQGDEAFEKLRKKGLLIKNIPPAEQRKKIISEVVFTRVPAPIRREILLLNWKERRAEHRKALSEYAQKVEYRAKMEEFAQNLQEEMAEKAEKKKRLEQHGIANGGHHSRIETLDSLVGTGADSGDLSQLLAEVPDAPHRPLFRTLLPVMKMFSLIALAQQRMGIQREERQIYKRLIGQLLRQYASRVKSPKGRSSARFTIAISSPTTVKQMDEGAGLTTKAPAAGKFDFAAVQNMKVNNGGGDGKPSILIPNSPAHRVSINSARGSIKG